MTGGISQSIYTLRFPLAVMVVFIHSFGFGEVDDYNIYNCLRIYITNIACQVAVPLFFFISGYLFYQRLSIWNWNVWREKMRARFWTLFIPYLIWNLIRLVFNNLLLDEKIAFTPNIWWHYTWVGSGYINWKGTVISLSTPLHIPFWFIRNLIVITLFTPLIYKIFLSRLDRIYILLLFITYISSIFPTIPGLCPRSLFFFSLGAYCSIHQINYLSRIRKYLPALIIISICTSIFLLIRHDSTSVRSVILPLFVLSSMGVCIDISSKTNKLLSWCRLKLFVDNTFFIFAFHSFVLVALYRFVDCSNLLGENSIANMIGLTGLYFLYPLIAICISILFSEFLKRYLPFIHKLLIGK